MTVIEDFGNRMKNFIKPWLINFFRTRTAPENKGERTACRYYGDSEKSFKHFFRDNFPERFPTIHIIQLKIEKAEWKVTC